MSDHHNRSQKDLAYLLGCIEVHKDKFPVPSHISELVAKVRAEFLSNSDNYIRPFNKEIYNVASAARDAYLRDVDANDQLSALSIAVDAALRFNNSPDTMHQAREEMRNVLVQADCLRHYSKLTDERQHKIGATVGELQASHFEDIAVRAFPELQSTLHQLRTEREKTNG